MAKELAFVLINPYTIRKSRTGGIIARYLARTDLRLVGARLYGPSKALAESFAALLMELESDCPDLNALTAEYVRQYYVPDPPTGKPHRTLCLLFEGEDAVRKIWTVTGSMRLIWGSGQSVRDTYGDLVTEPSGDVRYFEPAVLVGASFADVGRMLRLWLEHFDRDSGIIRGALDVPGGECVEQTLVLLKPDNFRVPSLRAGNIIDLLSCAGLKMVALKHFAMSVAQAEQFYEPVRLNLRQKFPEFARPRVAQAVSREFGIPIDESIVAPLCNELAPLYAGRQFENIVEFMTGVRLSACSEAEKKRPGNEVCLAIVYEGINAVALIRDALGSTNPTQARPGSVRREFGTNIMINAAHASDSRPNAEREMQILDVENDALFINRIQEYFG